LTAVFALLFLTVMTSFSGGITNWNQENGGIEWLSFVLLLLCPLAFFIHQPPTLWLLLAHIPVFTALLAKREAERDWWIIDERLLGGEFYAAQGFSLTAIAGALVVAVVLLGLAALFLRGVPACWRGLRDRPLWFILFVAGGLAGAMGQGLEELAEMRQATGAELWLLEVFEEGTEAVFAFLLLLSILAGPRQKPT